MLVTVPSTPVSGESACVGEVINPFFCRFVVFASPLVAERVCARAHIIGRREVRRRPSHARLPAPPVSWLAVRVRRDAARHGPRRRCCGVLALLDLVYMALRKLLK